MIDTFKKSEAYSYIRFSRPEQLRGDSLRRQLEASKQYAEENGYELNESQTFKDLGKSAYSGTHKRSGELRDFLEMIEKGSIPKGSILIVESLDRLSRDKVPDALDQFLDIMKMKSGCRFIQNV